MAERAYINKNTLKKLRELKMVSFTYIERETGFLQSTVERWENTSLSDEKSFPTIKQAKELAACYRVPFAAFFLEEDNLPKIPLPKLVNKRALFIGVNNDESAINLAVFDLLAKRKLYIEASNEIGDEMELFNAPSITTENVIDWAVLIRAFFELELSVQYKLNSKRQFFLYIRDKIERKGIFVNCFNGVSIDECRGLAIANEILPIIGLNADDRPPAKSFSIFHEVVHIFRKTSSFCNTLFDSCIADAEEVFCNAVAGEVLVPSDALKTIIREKQYSVFNSITIKFIADKFCVSREVIARRLLNMNTITQDEYDTLNTLFATELKQERDEAKASRTIITRNIPRETFDKTSNKLCIALLYGYGEGLFSRYDVASYLSVKPKHIDNIFGEVYAWNR